jgi:hypothetical protein
VARLVKVELPAFGVEQDFPELSLEIYQARMASAVRRLSEAGLDCLVVYGDREHFANLAYLTGFDPRFEEALFLIDAQGRKLLIVGNESLGYLPDPRLGHEVVLFQEFSLLGQPRSASRPLREIFGDFGIRTGTQAGCVGWKCFDGPLVDGGPAACDLPSYIVDLLRSLTGNQGRVVNATGIFVNPADGLRIISEPEQIAQFEYAAIRTSEGVRNLISHLRVGARERDLEPLLDSAGLPLSCHRMVGFGEKARRGLASPSDNRARLGDPFTIGFGVIGALTCRAGCVAHGPQDLPAQDRDFYTALAANYFDVVATWHERVHLGATGGEVFQAVEACRDRSLFEFAVNPGHCLHLDEWVHSPFAPGSRVEIRSGMVLQMDIIPVTRGPFYCINAEDGVAVANAELRAQIADKFPGCWERIQARRRFMTQVIGIGLHESVLPLGNTSGWLPPFALSPELVLVRR